jgi:hypothetical protein
VTTEAAADEAKALRHKLNSFMFAIAVNFLTDFFGNFHRNIQYLSGKDLVHSLVN